MPRKQKRRHPLKGAAAPWQVRSREEEDRSRRHVLEDDDDPREEEGAIAASSGGDPLREEEERTADPGPQGGGEGSPNRRPQTP